MDGRNAYPLEVYRELEPLCEKGHVVLVQNREDGQLYVKKRVRSYAPGLYHRLMEEPVENTPVIYGIYQDPDEAFVILIEEYLPGHTLAERLQEEGVFSGEECIRIGLALCGILRDLHSRKPAIIHRDIKPANVMLLPDGTVKLLDFSAAKTTSSGEKRDTVLIGTAGFAAPEQYGFSTSTAQTDIYSLGVLLNVLNTGALPWERQARGPLGRVIAHCLKIKPTERYADARELQAALKRAGRERFPWLPPGFRTLRWYQMIPAACYYLIFLALFWRLSFEDRMNGVDPLETQTVLVMLGLVPVLFYCNYLGMQRFFPFLRSHRRWVRVLGLALFPLWLWIGLLLVLPVVNLMYG